MGKKDEEILCEKAKKTSIVEGIFASIMDGSGLRYISPYALSIGANNAQIGFLTSIPTLLGNLSQLFTSKTLEKIPRKKLISNFVLLQALMWIPIIFVGYLFFYKGLDHGFSASLMIFFYTLLVLFGSFISPAWRSLMKDIVQKNCGAYFAKRDKILIATVVVTMICAGFILNHFTGVNLFFGFGIIFGIAFLARVVSYFLLKKYHEPKLKLEKNYYFSFWSFVKGVKKSNFGKFSFGVGLVNLATAIASPFVAVYVLKDLNFSYLIWTFIMIFNALGHFIFYPLWGKFADKFGNMRTIKWTGALIPLVPLFWFLTFFTMKINVPVTIGFIFAMEFFSGFAWAGFNLSTSNFIYDSVSRQKLALCVSYYNVFQGIGVFLGATLGGLIASMTSMIFGVSVLLGIFLLSAILRFLAYIFFIPRLKEVREVEPYEKGEFTKEAEEMFIPAAFRFPRHHHGHPHPLGP